MQPEVNLQWTFVPTIVLSVVVYAVAYTVRWRRVRAAHGPRGARRRHLVLWMVGLACLVIALMSPIDSAAEDLASAHMIQHLFLADLAPVALILALTKILLRPITRAVREVERRAGWLMHPVFGVVVYVGVMWIYHIPAVYDLALRNGAVHVVGHVAFFAAGLLYWWHLLSPIRSHLRLGGLAPVAYMASTKLLVGALGVLLTFYPKQIYRPYLTPGERLGMTPLVDQQVAGAIMGLEQSLVMGVGLAYLFARMLREADRADARAEALDAR